MKGIALILALIIFSTSLKASAFASGISGTINGDNASSYSCCKKSDDTAAKECSNSEEDEEESGCCEGDDCKCTCCLHIAFLQQFSHNSICLNDFLEVKFGYSFLYQDDYLTSVFHPPSFV